MTESSADDSQKTGDHWSPLQKTNVKVYSFHSLHLFSVMLSLSKHLAEALLEKVAKYPSRGIRKK